ncbi:MAG: hypothetical protein ACR2QO_06550 [Acidimicrobiales bacterium]
MAEDHVRASRAAIARVTREADGDDAPVLMLNLNRYSVEAGFPDGDDYRLYMSRLEHAVQADGGSVLWRTSVIDAVIGCDHDDYDEILAVWYPSHSAFLELPNADGAALMFESRKQCVAHATILALPADRYPLTPPQT